MAQEYDKITKHLFSDFATEISQFILGIKDIEVIDNIDTEQQIVIGQRTDSVKRIRINNSEVILHIELQLHDSTEKPMWARNASYQGYLLGKHQIPVYSNVLYFHPNAGRNDTGSYQYRSHGYEYTLRYKVIRLIDIDGQAILEMQTPGLLPFTPLMKPPTGMDNSQWVQECVNAVSASPVDQQTQADLYCAISLFGSIVHDVQLFKHIISEELMQQSKYYQLLREEFIAQGFEQGIEQGKTQGIEQGRTQGIEQGRTQGIEQGTRETTIKNTLTLLKNKFAEDAVNDIIPMLQHIKDIQQLEQLHLAASQVQSLDAFKLMLDE